MARMGFPQISERAYFAVRQAFRRALPSAVTVDWLRANVEGYNESSARSLLKQLENLKLIDATGRPTEVARKWRLDESYAEACGEILQGAYPSELAEAVAGSTASRDVVSSLFMARGLGAKTAQNVAQLFVLLANHRSEPVPASNAANASSRTRKVRRTSKPRPAEQVRATSRVAQEGGEAPATGAITVLRYFLEHGRLAELRLPNNVSRAELGRLFRHLEIDLLDHDDDAREGS